MTFPAIWAGATGACPRWRCTGETLTLRPARDCPGHTAQMVMAVQRQELVWSMFTCQSDRVDR